MAAVDAGLLKDAISGDPLAALLVHYGERLEALERRPVNEEAIHSLAYEAAAGARTEVRKLVEIEVQRMWPRIMLWMLLAAAAGFGAGWLAH